MHTDDLKTDRKFTGRCLAGQTFRRWTVLRNAGYKRRETKDPKRKLYLWFWECRCECGTIRIIQGQNLLSGISKSCGCLLSEVTSNRNYVHGMTDEGLYFTWKNMKGRCFNTRNPQYKDYGGRGITVCDEWKHDFAAFAEFMGTPPSPKHTVGRIDNDGPYSPDNVRWETRIQQGNNTRRNVFLEHDGLRLTVAQWSRHLGVNRDILYKRLYRGWPARRILETPVP